MRIVLNLGSFMEPEAHTHAFTELADAKPVGTMTATEFGTVISFCSILDT